jgi:parvulin-like peptidyl-prolyl isomerase
LLFGIWSLTPCFAQDKIIAVVNNDIITQKDLSDFLNFMRMQLSREYSKGAVEERVQSMKNDLLDKLIDDRLILQEAKKEKINLDETRVRTRVNEIRKHYPTDASFQNDLFRQGLVLADIETKIREQFLMVSVVDLKIRRKVSVSPEEVTRFYSQNSKEFLSPEKRLVQAVTLNNEDLAKTFVYNLRSGEKLTDLASRYPLSVNRMEVIRNGELKKEIEEVVFKLNRGGVSDPLESDDKYYVFIFEDIIPPVQKSLSQVQDKIHAYLFEKKIQEALIEWLDELKAKSYIKISQD